MTFHPTRCYSWLACVRRLSRSAQSIGNAGSQAHLRYVHRALGWRSRPQRQVRRRDCCPASAAAALASRSPLYVLLQAGAISGKQARPGARERWASHRGKSPWNGILGRNGAHCKSCKAKRLDCLQSKEDKKPDALETTEKYGLEAGLFKVSLCLAIHAVHDAVLSRSYQAPAAAWYNGDDCGRWRPCMHAAQVLSSSDQESPVSKTDQAKQLLAVYGSAYLLTSISLAIVSFTACYFAVDAGKLWCHFPADAS